MHFFHFHRWITFIVLTCFFTPSLLAAPWQIQISPYLYLPNTKTDITTQNQRSIAMKRPFSEVYSSIDDAYFIQLMARKDHWVILLDAHHVKLSEKGSITLPNTLTIDATGQLKYSALTALSGYRFMPEMHSPFYVELLTGVRYWSLKSTTQLSALNGLLSDAESINKQWFEPLIAARAAYHITSAWSLLGYVDSDLFAKNKSWQVGLTTNYQLTPHLIASAGYKWEMVKPELNNATINTRLNGLIFGLTLQF